MCSYRLTSFFIGFLLLVASGDSARRAEEMKLSAETEEAAKETGHLSLEAGLESKEDSDLSLEAEEEDEADYEDYPTDKKEGDTSDDTPDEESGDDSTSDEPDEADHGEIDEPESEPSSDGVSPPPPINFDEVRGMKKSAIWALVEERDDLLKEFSSMIKGRWKVHNKKERSIRRDWGAVKSKFDGLRAASKADQAEIDAMAGRVKAQKNEIRRLKSIVYKMR